MRTAIYLDHAATTPVAPAVLREMSEAMGRDGPFANPSSTHLAGRLAERSIERSRERIAERIGASAGRLVFTSGATESNNLALRGWLDGRPGALVTSHTEHESVLATARALAARGCRVRYVDCDGAGRIDPHAVGALLEAPGTLVSIMHVNNETGVVQDIAALAAQVHRHAGLLHVDAAQSIGKLVVDVGRWGADLVSLTAHKSHGPKGVGALYIRDGLRLEPMLYGGEQQQGWRPGTLATHQIVGMAAAYELADPANDAPGLAALSARLVEALLAIEGVTINGFAAPRAPHIVSASFPGIDGESLRFALEEIAVSAGSACASASPEVSHVLTRMGLSEARAGASLRFSVGRDTSPAEIDLAAARVREEVGHLRELAGSAPRWCWS